MLPAAALPDSALVAHVVERHHAYARRAIAYIVPLLVKITGRHRARNQKLGALCDAGHELADSLETHLEEEERELFPALLSAPSRRDAPRPQLDDVQRQQRQLDLILARIRWLADDYRAPAWAGRSYQLLMEELEALEVDVREHLEIQKNVLIPRLFSRRAEAA